MIRPIVFLAFVWGFWGAPTVTADILVLNEDRRVTSSVIVADGVDTDFDQASEVAPDSGPFDVTLTTDAAVGGASAASVAAQTSMFTNVLIHGSGHATGEAYVGAKGSAYAAGSSNIAMRFLIEHSTTYSVDGFLEGAENSTMTLQISRPFETIAWFSASDEHLPVTQSGVLEPGTYDLNVTCSLVANADPPNGFVSRASAYDVLVQFGPGTDAPLPAAASASLRAFPNPFRASTRLSVPEGVERVLVLDTRGRLVRTLPASPTVVFDGRDEGGRPLASGVYWVKPVGETAFVATKIVRLQ